ncbi:hypothetical protein [Nonomuraea sp. 10N515B]|uniref:hypothetical protein n=1 Tax=Nonomuraea sp. 10N515B TaxID=3457422 RepID=UPI003FCCBEF0
MSYDLAFWKASTEAPKESYDLACEGGYDHLTVAPAVMLFRTRVTQEWPDLVGALEPSEDDPDNTPDDFSRCLLLTLPWTMVDRIPAIVQLAQEFELAGYDPQTETALPA